MREEILNLLLQKSQEIFEVSADELSEKTRFADLSAKSFQLVQIIACLENEFDVEIPYMNFNRQQTIGDAVSYVLELVEE